MHSSECAHSHARTAILLRTNLVYYQRAKLHNERSVDNETDIMSSCDDWGILLTVQPFGSCVTFDLYNP